jgi:hypothetical protein
MSETPVAHPNVLKINPGSIKIENFIPGRVYKDSLKLTNISKNPIVFTIKSNDKSKLILNKTFLRIEGNETQTIDLAIQDRDDYSSKKLPKKPKKLYIHMNGELICEKYEIELIYFCHKNIINNYGHKTKLGMGNNNYKEVPSYYLKHIQNLGNSRVKKNETLLIVKTCTFFIQSSEINEIRNLKNTINNLLQQIYYLKNNNNGKLNNYNYNKMNKFHNLSKRNYSFFIINNKLYDPKGKFKIDNDIEKNAIIDKNKVLLIENSILTHKIKILEEKLYEIKNKEKEKIDFKEYSSYLSKSSNNYFQNNDEELYNENEKNIYEHHFKEKK